MSVWPAREGRKRLSERTLARPALRRVPRFRPLVTEQRTSDRHAGSRRYQSEGFAVSKQRRRRKVPVVVSRGTVCPVGRGIRIFRNFEAAEDADDQFYAQLTPEERLDLLLELTERERSTLGEAAEGFERVHRIVELSQR